MNERWDLVFSTMTKVETELWVRVAAEFERAGYRTAFILFDESAAELVESFGIKAFSFFDLLDHSPLDLDDETAFVRSFDIGNLRNAYMHEKLAYGRSDEHHLRRRVLHYLQVMERFFQHAEIGCVIQEMGGFIACNAIFAAARKHGVPHVFYEPGPFAKRIVFTLNSFYADVPDELLQATPAPQAIERAAELRSAYLRQPSYVVPAKDRHSFRDMTFSRMFNSFNAGRLSSKLWRKYIRHQREEFDEIGFVVRKNGLKLLRRQGFSPLYTGVDPAQLRPYVYFPLHVPHDVQLTVRSKLFFFQEALLEYISRILPPDYMLLVKEHPAAIGGHPLRLWRQLLRERPNVKLIHPRYSSYELIANAEVVITVNSKVGFETIMQGRRAVVLGSAFYRDKGLTFDVESLNALEAALGAALAWSPPAEERVLRFLAQVYEWTYPCELFDPAPANCRDAFEGLRDYLERQQILRKAPLLEERAG